jgi:ATP-binding cassette subfamily B protein
MRQNENKKQLSDYQVLKRLFALYAKHNKNTLIICFVSSLVNGVRPYILIILSGILIDGLVQKVALQTLFQYLAVGLGINLMFRIVESKLREMLNARVENCLEQQDLDMNEQSMEIDFENLENPEVQEKKRKQEQVVNIRGGIYWMLVWPLNRIISGLISVITALFVSAPLFINNGQTEMKGFGIISIVLLGIVVACAFASYHNSRYWSVKTRGAFEEYSKCNRVSNYILHNILFGNETGKDLRVFHQQDLIKKGVLGRADETKAALKRNRIFEMKQSGIEATLSTLSCGLVYLYAAIKAYMGLITIGSVVKFATSIIKCVDSMKELLFGLASWRRLVDYGRDYLDYIDFKNEKKLGTYVPEQSNMRQLDIECDNVSFAYPDSKHYSIENMNLKLTLRPGDRIAIVGKNGSGKTTFIKLLCRLYDVTEGSIRINGKDIRDYDYEEYLKIFAVIFQDYRVFSLKLGENLSASEEFDEELAKEALEKAGFAERFSKMSKGLDTYIGKEFDESGENVSGGERQKIAIARAIYKNTPLVIMDEPTAALDPISECEIYEGFDRLVGDKAAIYISHRLASCRFCNNILVFDKGNVIQNGSHEDLVEKDGLYQKLWEAQAQYYNV